MIADVMTSLSHQWPLKIYNIIVENSVRTLATRGRKRVPASEAQRGGMERSGRSEGQYRLRHMILPLTPYLRSGLSGGSAARGNPSHKKGGPKSSHKPQGRKKTTPTGY